MASPFPRRSSPFDFLKYPHFFPIPFLKVYIQSTRPRAKRPRSFFVLFTPRHYAHRQNSAPLATRI